MGQNRLMNRKTRELALLCIIAATSGMLAWTLDRPITATAFAAVATFMAICLVSIVGQSK
jgi:membrane protein YdbS with pleckstrin-like domain